MEYYSVLKMWDQDGERHSSKQNEIISNGCTLQNSIFSLRKANYGKSDKVWMFQKCGMKAEAEGKEIYLSKWSYSGLIISWYDQDNKWSNNTFFWTQRKSKRSRRLHKLWAPGDNGVSNVSGEYVLIGGSEPLCGVEDREDCTCVEVSDRQIL